MSTPAEKAAEKAKAEAEAAVAVAEAAKAAKAADPKTNVRLGVTFDLNGETIALEPKQAITEIKQKGIDLELPKRMVLGQVGKNVDAIFTQLGSKMTVEEIKGNLPEFTPLTALYDKVTEATLSVERFHAKIPGDGTETKLPGDEKIEKPDPVKKTVNGTEAKPEAKKPILYTIGLSATWELDGTETGLTLTGIYFEVSNEKPVLDDQSSEGQKGTDA